MHFYVALNFNVGLYRQHEDKRKSDFSILEYKKSCYVFAVTYYTLNEKISGGFCMGLSSLALIQLGMIMQTIGIG